MRRTDREIADPGQIEAIIKDCRVCRLGLTDGDQPYVVPLNFGYCRRGDGYVFYFHCASEGKKLDLLRKNPRVCLELDRGHALEEGGDHACAYSYRFQSVIARGTAALVEDVEEKKVALSALMRQQTGREFTFTDEETRTVTVGRIDVAELTAKAR